MSERAPLLLVFGDLASRVAALLHTRPGLISRLAFAPREAIHSIGAFLHLSPEADGADHEVAEAIDSSDPRDLLRAALPNCPRELYKALDRAGDYVREKEFYAAIGAISVSPVGAEFLAGRLDDDRIDFYRSLGRMDPLVATLHHAIPEQPSAANALDCLSAYLRAHNAIDGAQTPLPAKAGPAAVLRRLIRALDNVQAPDPGFVPPEPLRLVRSIGELRDIATKFRNCLRHPRFYNSGGWFSLAAGATAFFHGNEPPLLLSLKKVGPGIWMVEQLAGPANKAIPQEVRTSIVRGLREAGVRVVQTDAASALSHLSFYAGQRRGADVDDPDDDDEGYEADALVA